VNGDGVPDILVGAGAYDADANINQGRAYLFRGADGGLLRTFAHPNELVGSDAHFGRALAGLGDANGDGVPEVAVGASEAPNTVGQVFLFSGATGNLLQTLDYPLPGPQAPARFGWALTAGVDTNGDGVSELLVGAPSVPGMGQVFIYLSAGTPAQRIKKLIAGVAALNLKQGITNSLDAKLDAALQALQDMQENNNVAAINALQAFINGVEAQRGIHITDADADQLIAAAQAIIAQLGL